MIEICGAWNGNSKAFNFGKLGNRVKLFPIHSQNARFRNYREQKVSASVPHLPSPGNSPIFQFRSAMIPVWFRFEFREVWIKEEFFEWFSSLSLRFCEVQITFKFALPWPSWWPDPNNLNENKFELYVSNRGKSTKIIQKLKFLHDYQMRKLKSWWSIIDSKSELGITKLKN